MEPDDKSYLHKNYAVTVVIPTYKRADLLSHVLSALEQQKYKNFNVLVVVKPSGDGTEDLVASFDASLNIKYVKQTSGYFVDALNLGIESATGEIVAFLDDDAIPCQDWLQNLVQTYNLPNVGGVAGEVIPAFLNEEKAIVFRENSSEVIPSTEPFLNKVARKLWSCPIDGLEDYLVYVSKAGMVNYSFQAADKAHHQITKSLLGMGANMSVLSKALKGFKFPNSWILGLSNEQFLAWHVWKKGYVVLFNPEAKVYHLAHGQTLTRQVVDGRRDVLRQVESMLLFNRLYGEEHGISTLHRLTWLLFETTSDLKKICVNKEVFRINSLKSKFYCAVIGAKWFLSKSVGGNYSPLLDLKKMV